jgi:hypothetical protein
VAGLIESSVCKNVVIQYSHILKWRYGKTLDEGKQKESKNEGRPGARGNEDWCVCVCVCVCVRARARAFDVWLVFSAFLHPKKIRFKRREDIERWQCARWSNPADIPTKAMQVDECTTNPNNLEYCVYWLEQEASLLDLKGTTNLWRTNELW